MMTDFTVFTYLQLLENLNIRDFSFLSFKESNLKSSEKKILLRHDVDSLPLNSLKFAIIQAEMGIRGSYYFRVVPSSWDAAVIKQIASMGHEIGYHYEDLSFAFAKLKTQGIRHKSQGVDYEKKLVEVGIESFERNLELFRKVVPVNRICMHGSPMSKWDSRLLWKYYDYKDFGIEFEPYFDVSFEDRLYLTDTGRRWNGSNVSVRDKTQDPRLRQDFGGQVRQKEQGREPYEGWVRKPIKGSLMNMTPKALEFQNQYSFKHTKDIMKAIEIDNLPEKVMMTFHPQRWTDKPLPWLKELVWQNSKNIAKYFLIKLNN